MKVIIKKKKADEQLITNMQDLIRKALCILLLNFTMKSCELDSFMISA